MTNLLSSPGTSAILVAIFIILVCLIVSLLAWAICGIFDWLTGNLHPRSHYKQMTYDHSRKRWLPAKRTLDQPDD